LNEWLAACVCDAFNQLHMLYGTVTEFCTPAECPVMNAGPKYEYLWSDGQQYKKPTKVSAPVYVDLLMNWVQMQLDDEAIFPSSANGTFPKTFVATVKKIVGRLFRVYGHIYHSHLGRIMDLNELQHLNTSFKHFMLFVREFDLMDLKEQAPLKDVMEAMSFE
jgi:MOB kinase activator 1